MSELRVSRSNWQVEVESINEAGLVRLTITAPGKLAAEGPRLCELVLRLDPAEAYEIATRLKDAAWIVEDALDEEAQP